MTSPVATFAASIIPGLKPGSGDNWTGYCPIHGEQPGLSRPSFSINIRTGQWHCFSQCGGGGLPLLLKKLAKPSEYIDRTISRLSEYLEKPQQRAVLHGGTLGVFYADNPLPEKLLGLFDAEVPAELVDDGFDPAVLRDNDVGVDTDLDRTVYAIRDLRGYLAGFVGKPHDQTSYGKYIVYERELHALGFKDYHFNNKNCLWRWDKVYPVLYHSRKPQTLYVTEGFKACLWLVQHGYLNTVALMGTSLSTIQQRFFDRIGGKLVLCLDDDDAGRAGTNKICYKNAGRDIAVINYPVPPDGVEKVQPDDLTPESLQSALDRPLSVRQWRNKYDYKS